jgi:hypothetical protein
MNNQACMTSIANDGKTADDRRSGAAVFAAGFCGRLSMIRRPVSADFSDCR